MTQTENLQQNAERFKNWTKTQEFIALVSEMREAQRAFFRTRERVYMNQAKQLEKAVDRLLNEIITPESSKDSNQQNLGL